LIDRGGTAVIEMAEASGLAQLGGRTYNPWIATTYGTGQLIRNAMERGVKKVLLGIGGSATNDGGAGLAESIGYQFLDSRGNLIKDLPDRLLEAVKILPPADLANFPEVIVACDVANQLLGPDGCTRVYGSQKGIAKSDFERHETRLSHLVALTNSHEVAEIPGSGAAGGLGFGAIYFLGGSLQPGFELIAKVLKLEPAVIWADLIITGEGKIDAQSFQGKAPCGVAELAKKHNKPIVAFCGVCDPHVRTPFDRIWEIERGSHTLSEAMRNGSHLLRETARLAKPEIDRLSRVSE
jgi:glycerate 2-kinase